jgi:hypothetical protein
MNLVMCRRCGEFVTAVPTESDGGNEMRLEPVADACPECGGDNFETTS